MKNIHLLPTDKPNFGKYLVLNKEGILCIWNTNTMGSQKTLPTQNIYITSDEEIKEGDWVVENHTFKREPYIGKCFYPKNDGTVTDEILKRDLLSVKYEGHYETLALTHNCKKIILTTDQDLIKNGVQAIDDEFLEWFVNNPGCESVEVDYDVIITQDKPLIQHQGSEPIVVPHKNTYKIIIPQEEPNYNMKQEILDEMKRIEEPKKEYNYIGECNGNKGNGCFMDSSGHDCGCFIRVLKEENKQEIVINEKCSKCGSSQYQIGKPFCTDEFCNTNIGKASEDYWFKQPYNEDAFVEGAKWMAERMYSEKEVIEIVEKSRATGLTAEYLILTEQFKKK